MQTRVLGHFIAMFRGGEFTVLLHCVITNRRTRGDNSSIFRTFRRLLRFHSMEATYLICFMAFLARLGRKWRCFAIDGRCVHTAHVPKMPVICLYDDTTAVVRKHNL